MKSHESKHHSTGAGRGLGKHNLEGMERTRQPGHQAGFAGGQSQRGACGGKRRPAGAQRRGAEGFPKVEPFGVISMQESSRESGLVVTQCFART